MTRIYSGTASVVNGNATVTISSGAPLTDANCPVDSCVALNGVLYFVASRTDTTHFVLTRTYAGSTGSVTIELDPLTPAALSVVNASLAAANVQQQLNVLDKNSQGLFYTRVGVTGASDPGPGNMAVNSGTPASITAMYLDNVDANGNGVDGVIDLWLAGTVVLIRSLATGSTAYLALQLPSGVVNSGGYRTAATTYVDHDGVLADGEQVTISFSRVGQGLKIDLAGVYSGRAAHDGEAAGYVYLSTDGAGGLGGAAALYLKNSAASGDWSPAIAFQGTAGDTGWTPNLLLVNDGARRIIQLTGYYGGTGVAPTTNVGKYMGASGFVTLTSDALDLRGSTGAAGADGATGAAGSNGTNGTNGTDPGSLYNYDSSNVDANPASGGIRTSSGTLTASTWMDVSKTNRSGNSMATWLATLDDASNLIFGTFVLTRISDKAQIVGQVVSLADNTGFVKLGIQAVSGAASFSNNDPISFQFYRSGDQGATGAGTGSFNGPGTSVINNVITFNSTDGTVGKDSGVAISDVTRDSNNLSDLTSKQAGFDNLSLLGADIAAAATPNLDTATGSEIEITGSTGISGFTLTSGKRRHLRFSGAPLITVGASLVVVNAGSGVNYQVVAGDTARVWADGSVVYMEITPINGFMPKAAPRDAPVFTTSVTLPGNATSALQAVPKQQLDFLFAGLGGL